MDSDTWQTLGAGGALLLVGGYNALKARRAAKQTESTGNGFAHTVTSALTRIESKVGSVERKIDDHIAVHAEADVLREKR